MNKLNKSVVSGVLAGSLCPLTAFAAPGGAPGAPAAPTAVTSQRFLHAVANPSTRLNDMIFGQANNSQDFVVKLHVDCFGTNLRLVSNPIAPQSAVFFALGIGPKGGERPIGLVFPAFLVKKDEVTPSPVPTKISLPTTSPGDTFAWGTKNLVTVRLASPPPQVTSLIAGNGAYSGAARSGLIAYLNFRQDITGRGNPVARLDDWTRPTRNPSGIQPKTGTAALFAPVLSLISSLAYAGGGDGGGDGGAPNFQAENNPDNNNGPLGTEFGVGAIPPPLQLQMANEGTAYMGVDGDLSADYSLNWSSNLMQLDIYAAFPGQPGFCGGYYSPLMLFFDDKRPQFTSYTQFRVQPDQHHSNWPEVGSSGYFLALDVNGDGKINDGSELFGDGPRFKNGFEALSVLDSNRDGQISRADEKFSQLRLWHDVDSDGVSREAELLPLNKKGVTSISLKYRGDQVTPLGVRAEYRERSTFAFKQDGKSKKGEIIDVWLSSDR